MKEETYQDEEYSHDNIQYMLDVEYDERVYGDPDDDYHSNDAYIINPRVVGMSWVLMTDHFGFKVDETPISNYCFNKLFNGRDFKCNFNFDFNISGGYYGDDIDSITCSDPHLRKTLLRFSQMSESDMVKETLINEYGHLLSQLEKFQQVKLIELSKDQFRPTPKTGTRRNHEKDYYLSPSREEFICGIITENGDGTYKLIDGHNRFQEWMEDPKKKVKFILMY